MYAAPQHLDESSMRKFCKVYVYKMRRSRIITLRGSRALKKVQGAEKSPPNKYYYLLGHYNGLKGLRGIINLMCKNKIQSVLT